MILLIGHGKKGVKRSYLVEIGIKYVHNEGRRGLSSKNDTGCRHDISQWMVEGRIVLGNWV
jgi:hypothetical protein